MRLFGLEISRARSTSPVLGGGAGGRGGWFPVVREPFTGAWQQNADITVPSVLANPIVWGCVTLIATDIGKLTLRLVTKDADGIWHETSSPAYSPVLRKPNRHQTMPKFVEHWITSKLLAGNAYVLKQRDDRRVVVGMYVLDPAKVRPLVTPDGAIYYELDTDQIVGLVPTDGPLVVPARELIHDPYACPFSPLVGVSPLYACGLAAQQGLTMTSQSELFFRTGSHPGGVLTAPGAIGTETAQRLKSYWEANFSGANVGRVAVLGDGLKYEGMTVNAAESQLIEQFRWTAQQICTAFHVPPALLDLGDPGPVTDIEPLLQKYHSQCIQSLLINFESKLDEGLEFKSPNLGTEFDIDDLIWIGDGDESEGGG